MVRINVTFLTRTIISGSKAKASGSRRSIDLIGTLLSERGHEVTILTLSSQKNQLTGEMPYAVREVREMAPKRPEFYDTVVPAVLREHEGATDVFHVFEPQLLVGAGKYATSGNTSVVGRLNNYGTFCFNPSMMDQECHKSCNAVKRFSHYDGSLTKKLALVPFMMNADRRIDRLNDVSTLFAQSPAVEAIYRDIGVNEPNMTVVPNTYHESYFTVDGSSPPEIDEDGVDVLYAGRLIHWKGVDVLVRAAAELSQGVRVHIAGDGPERSRLVDYAEAHDIEGLYFHGAVDHDDLAGYYRNSDIYVHPGHWPDPCPRSVIEALGFGIPLVVSDIGGPPWMGSDACLTFPPGDGEILAERIRRLQRDDATRCELAENTADALQRFDPERIIQRYETEYEKVLS